MSMSPQSMSGLKLRNGILQKVSEQLSWARDTEEQYWEQVTCGLDCRVRRCIVMGVSIARNRGPVSNIRSLKKTTSFRVSSHFNVLGKKIQPSPCGQTFHLWSCLLFCSRSIAPLRLSLLSDYWGCARLSVIAGSLGPGLRLLLPHFPSNRSIVLNHSLHYTV